MEQNFQTSFIPKKPMVEERITPTTSSTSFFKIIAIFVFFTVLVASGGLYFYKGMLAKNIESMKVSLDKSKNNFEPGQIVRLKTLDRRLNAASTILGRHISISPIFKTLQDNTMKSIRYTKFDYQIGTEKNPSIKINMSGQALDYNAVAVQSDLFKKDKNIIDPVFSNLSVDDKNNTTFDLSFFVDPAFVNYKQGLSTGGDSIPSTIDTSAGTLN